MRQRFFTYCLFLGVALVSGACDSAAPPELMKATQQFESEEIRDEHSAYMRKNHMDALKHKRDETVYNGIRTEHHSLHACINCHVPKSYKSKILRHTDPEHFCTTCHSYVAAKLDCFECHVDHPVSEKMTDNNADNSYQDRNDVDDNDVDSNVISPINFALLGLATATDLKLEKSPKSGGVSFLVTESTSRQHKQISNAEGASDE